MANKVGIGVEAQFDTKDVERQINALGQKIAQANKVQFTPFSKTTQSDVERIIKQFEQLKKIHGELNRRMGATGQGGATLFNMDWDKLYVDPATRARQMRKVFEYTTGAAFQGPTGQGGAPSGGSGVGGMVSQVAQAGLRASGSVGGVAANALGSGVSSGFGAGLMGLLGGMMALGVGKLVGGVMEKLDQAQANDVAMDRLKRTLGDVNVSFEALKSVVNAGANNLKVTYAEAGQLAQQFAKLGNVTGGQYKSLAAELEVGVGLSRSFGLDPSQGVGVMGQMRGLGITTSTQESRRFALLIGETIGKSGAFAKADEVMGAIADFAGSQTRNNMGAANVAGYAGLFSALVGSGVPGLDPQGAAGLLSRVNASLSGGGAKGEASQFFTAQVGSRLGLDPIQTQIFREGGAFATNDSMFGAGSAAARFGIAGPGGNKTYLQASLEELRRQYGGNKGLLAQAAANHLGIGINQAMTLLSINPNEIGEMQKYGDLGKLTSSGIGNISKALYGNSDDRKALADSFLRRQDVSSADKEKLSSVMGSGSEAAQREMLARLSAQYDQEKTMGSDIRDSKARLDNIATTLADKLVPLTQEMRHGIMAIAGNGSKSPREIMADVLKLESKDRQESIKGDYAGKRQAAVDEAKAILTQRDEALSQLKKNRANMTPEEIAAAQNRIIGLTDQYTRKAEEVRLRILKLMEEEAEAIKKEVEERNKRIEDLKKQPVNPDAPTESGSGQIPAGTGGSGGRYFSTGAAATVPGNQSISRRRGGRHFGALANDPALRQDVSAAEREIGAPPGLMWAQMEQESGFDPNAVSPAGAMGLAQVMPGTLASLERRLGRKLNPYDPKDAVLIQKEVMRENYDRFGSWDDALRAYNGGWNKSRWGNRETSSYVPSIYERWVRNGRGTPLPEQFASAGNSNFWSGMPITGEMALSLDLSPDARRLLAPPSLPVFTRFGPAAPFGTNVANR